ncbi:DUF6875 domain-containing protein [Mycobacterium sp.]|uniref:DUF6875 domain-containing protein n=1 Tax=Mycobacterium sp. TaxID=1785 RepID=UPI003D0FEDBD
MNEQCRGGVGLPVELTFADPAPPPGSEREFEMMQCWAEKWLSKSHPNLGRGGAICPFMETTIKKDLLRAAFLRGDHFDTDSLIGLLVKIAAAFPGLSPADGPDSNYKAVLMVFPELTDFGQLDAVQRQSKTAFVQRGLMIGQFYPGHQQGGLHNPNFQPLNAPLPMLAVRNMVVSDYPFLCGNEQWMAAYLSRFASGTFVANSLGGRQKVCRPEAV